MEYSELLLQTLSLTPLMKEEASQESFDVAVKANEQARELILELSARLMDAESERDKIRYITTVKIGQLENEIQQLRTKYEPLD